MVGVFDLASNVTEGIRNTTTVNDAIIDRVRPPRHIGADGILRVRVNYEYCEKQMIYCTYLHPVSSLAILCQRSARPAMAEDGRRWAI